VNGDAPPSESGPGAPRRSLVLAAAAGPGAGSPPLEPWREYIRRLDPADRPAVAAMLQSLVSKVGASGAGSSGS